MNKQLFNRVKEVIIDQLGVNGEQVIPDANFNDDLGADSLDCVELLMGIEEEFAIEIEDSDAEKLVTVGKLVEFLETKDFE